MTTNRATLKGFFETGDFPTEGEFGQWLDSIPIWTKVTKVFSDFQPAAGASNTITLFSGAAGTTPQAAKIKHTTSFTGGATTLSVIKVDDSNGNAVQPFFDVFQAPGNTVGEINNAVNLVAIPDQSVASNYTVTLQIVGDVINSLVAGSVDLWILEGPVI